MRETCRAQEGKMGQVAKVSPQPSSLRGNLRAQGGGAERAGGSHRACSVLSPKQRARHAL